MFQSPVAAEGGSQVDDDTLSGSDAVAVVEADGIELAKQQIFGDTSSLEEDEEDLRPRDPRRTPAASAAPAAPLVSPPVKKQARGLAGWLVGAPPAKRARGEAPQDRFACK